MSAKRHRQAHWQQPWLFSRIATTSAFSPEAKSPKGIMIYTPNIYEIETKSHVYSKKICRV
jgi:hypothetical protein